MFSGGRGFSSAMVTAIACWTWVVSTLGIVVWYDASKAVKPTGAVSPNEVQLVRVLDG